MVVSVGMVLLVGTAVWLVGITVVISLLYAFDEREQSGRKVETRT